MSTNHGDTGECACCGAVGPLVRYDDELKGWVDHDCLIKLRWASARLKVAGIVRCTHANGSRGNDEQKEAA